MAHKHMQWQIQRRPSPLEAILVHAEGPIYGINWRVGNIANLHRKLLWAHNRAGAPLFPLVHLLPHLLPFYFSFSFIGFTYFLLLSISSLSTRIVPLRFQAGGHRRRPNLGLVCLLCNLCSLYSLVKMYCGVLFYFCFVCSFSALTLLVGSFDP